MKLEVQFRKKPAPVKGYNLQLKFLESKVEVIEEREANVRRLNLTLCLPQLAKVILAWEKPRDGDRSKILQVFFKFRQGITRMLDLLHGLKADIIEGFPPQFED